MSAPPVVLSACRVLIVDEHPVMRVGVRSVMEREAGLEVVAEAGTDETALELARFHLPDLALVDVSPPQLAGVEVTRRIVRDVPSVRVLVLSAHDGPELARTVLGVGASGYSLKRSATEELMRAVRAVAAGGVYIDPLLASAPFGEGGAAAATNDAGVALSERESEVIHRIARGQTPKQIAESMGISPRTLETYKARAMWKLGIRTRADLVRHSLRAGWLRDG